MKNFKGALKDLNTLIKIDSDFNDSAIFLRGWIHTNLKIYSDAIDDYSRSIKNNVEVNQIKNACNITKKGFVRVLNFVKPIVKMFFLTHFKISSLPRNPFAPSIIREKLSEWFDLDIDSPYMLVVADIIIICCCSMHRWCSCINIFQKSLSN